MNSAIKYGLWKKDENPDETTQSIMNYNKENYVMKYSGHDRRNLSASAVAEWVTKDIRRKNPELTIADGDLLTIERENGDGKVEAYRSTHGVLIVLEDLIISHGVEDFSDKESVLDQIPRNKKLSHQQEEKAKQAREREREKNQKKKKKKDKAKEECR